MRDYPPSCPAELTGAAGGGEGPGEARAALPGLAQPLLGVFGQEIAQRDATAPGLGREPLGKVTRNDDGMVHAVVALPAFVTIPRQLNSALGGAYGNFVQQQRLLDKEAFWVFVTP